MKSEEFLDLIAHACRLSNLLLSGSTSKPRETVLNSIQSIKELYFSKECLSVSQGLKELDEHVKNILVNGQLNTLQHKSFLTLFLSVNKALNLVLSSSILPLSNQNRIASRPLSKEEKASKKGIVNRVESPISKIPITKEPFLFAKKKQLKEESVAEETSISQIPLSDFKM